MNSTFPPRRTQAASLWSIVALTTHANLTQHHIPLLRQSIWHPFKMKVGSSSEPGHGGFKFDCGRLERYGSSMGRLSCMPFLKLGCISVVHLFVLWVFFSQPWGNGAVPMTRGWAPMRVYETFEECRGVADTIQRPAACLLYDEPDPQPMSTLRPRKT